MKWGIIGAMEQEVQLIVEHMLLEQTTQMYGSTYYIGTIDSVEIVVVNCGIGTINAAICANMLIREYGVTILLNTGIAGGLSESLCVMDVVLSTEVLYHSKDLDTLANYYPYKKSFIADSHLLNLAQSCIDDMSGIKYKIGKVASNDIFVKDTQAKAKIIKKHNPLCVEMEGAAIGQVAFMNQIPFLVIRSISDYADENAEISFQELIHVASNNAANIVLKMIEKE